MSPELFKQLNDSSLDNRQLLDAVFGIIDCVSDEKPRPSKPQNSFDISFAVRLFWILRPDYPTLSDDDLLNIVEEITGIKPPPSALEQDR